MEKEIVKTYAINISTITGVVRINDKNMITDLEDLGDSTTKVTLNLLGSPYYLYSTTNIKDIEKLLK